MNRTDTNGDAECDQNGIDQTNRSGKVITVKEIPDRCGQGDTGNKDDQSSDDDLIHMKYRKDKTCQKSTKCHKGTGKNRLDHFRKLGFRHAVLGKGKEDAHRSCGDKIQNASTEQIREAAAADGAGDHSNPQGKNRCVQDKLHFCHRIIQRKGFFTNPP